MCLTSHAYLLPYKCCRGGSVNILKPRNFILLVWCAQFHFNHGGHGGETLELYRLVLWFELNRHRFFLAKPMLKSLMWCLHPLVLIIARLNHYQHQNLLNLQREKGIFTNEVGLPGRHQPPRLTEMRVAKSVFLEKDRHDRL